MSKSINIGFIGAGAIGCLFGGYISQVDFDDTKINMYLFTREKYKNVIDKDGLTIEKNGVPKKIINLHVEHRSLYPNTNNIEESYAFQYLFLTTKAYDIESAINEYKNLIEKSKYFIILQNGIGNEEYILEMFPNIKLIRALTTNGALMEKNGYVIHTGEGLSKLGYVKTETSGNHYLIDEKLKTDIENLKSILIRAGFETVIVNDIEKECWEKVFVNIGINAFGALTGLRNGDLLQHQGIRDLMRKAVLEALNIAIAKGIKLTDKDYVKVMLGVAEKTAQNKNSMLQDILKGKSKTEISYMNGKILSYGKKLNMEVSINEVLTNLIHGLEMKNQEK